MRSTKQKVKVGRAVFPRLPKHAGRRAATASGGQGRVTRARTAAWRRVADVQQAEHLALTASFLSRSSQANP